MTEPKPVFILRWNQAVGGWSDQDNCTITIVGQPVGPDRRWPGFGTGVVLFSIYF